MTTANISDEHKELIRAYAKADDELLKIKERIKALEGARSDLLSQFQEKTGIIKFLYKGQQVTICTRGKLKFLKGRSQDTGLASFDE
jgi:hypothetical protein